jgi:hypothetical protein
MRLEPIPHHLLAPVVVAMKTGCGEVAGAILSSIHLCLLVFDGWPRVAVTREGALAVTADAVLRRDQASK